MPKDGRTISLQYRNPLAAVFLTIITFGLYKIYWLAVTRGQLKAAGADIPTTWLIIVPLVNIWWLWKFSVGYEKVSKRQLSAPIVFIILWLLDFLSAGILQYELNELNNSHARTTERS